MISDLSNLIDERGIKKKFIAEKLDISATWVSVLIKNPTRFTAAQISALIDILKVSDNDLPAFLKLFGINL